ncbi:MAG: FG-GAP repeat domain-containing protein [Planctomycetota bacterium]|jgi:hypothetical protein
MKTSTRLIMIVPTIVAITAFGQPVPEWTQATGRISMSPARFADVDGDGTKELIVASGGPIGNPFGAGIVHVLDGAGNELPGWPVLLGNNLPIFGPAVAVGDLDDNGDLELVVEGWFRVHVWNHDGTSFPGWPLATGTTFHTSTALADLDEDGDLEIIAPIANVMHVWHHTGQEASGWPFTADENFQAASVGDVDGDGAPEIVAGTWRVQFPDVVPFELYMWEANGDVAPGFPIGNLGSVRGPVSLGDVDGDGAIEIVARNGDNLHVFDAAGQTESGWPIVPDLIRNATPSLGDLDGDGDLEIVIGGFDIHAYHDDGTVVSGWPVDVGATGNMNSGPVLASIDGDAGTVEVIAKIPNAIVALDAGGSMLPGFPFALSDNGQTSTFSPSPVVGDVEGDGDVEYAFVSVSGTIAYFDESEPSSGQTAFWPTFQHDQHNTSFLGDACPWDCQATPDGVVGIADLLALLAQWGGPGSCAFDGGPVGINDLLELLANWGQCP